MKKYTFLSTLIVSALAVTTVFADGEQHGGGCQNALHFLFSLFGGCQ